MKTLYDSVSENCSKIVTHTYSTSFSLATKMLDSSIRNHIYNIYGFVRFADEIVDTFHDYPKKELLDRFEEDLYYSINNKISLNPILNSFQKTVNIFEIDHKLIKAFLKSMRWDLKKHIQDRQRVQRIHLWFCRRRWLDVFKSFRKREKRRLREFKVFCDGVRFRISESKFLERFKK